MAKLTDAQRNTLIELLTAGNIDALKEQRDILSGGSVVLHTEWDLLRVYQTVRSDETPYQPKLIDRSGLDLIPQQAKYARYQNDWNAFAEDILGVSLDPDQQAILRSVQENKLTSVVSGTARGKDFVAAVAALCFLYLTPKWNEKGELIENTKIAFTAPTERQIQDICFPEIARLFGRARCLPGRLTGYGIRFPENKEWFLTGFKSDEHSPESWSGFHAVNTMFVVTEASGIPESIFNAITGNLQGNSRILIVFNPNNTTGYAAATQKSPAWQKFRLDSLNAPNVLQKKELIPGQVNWDWVNDQVRAWCTKIDPESFNTAEGDFEWEGATYRPNDLFRVKVRGMFPKVSADVLVPPEWIRFAQDRWKEAQTGHIQDTMGNKGTPGKLLKMKKPLRLGVDIAGMGRDSSCFAFRYGPYVEKFELIPSSGTANHMEVTGKIVSIAKTHTNTFRGLHPQAFIDTIGEGAGVYSRLREQNIPNVHSCKFSESATDASGNPLKDLTGQYEFLNMRVYLYWAVRDWLDPANKTAACLPPGDEILQDLTETKWEFLSNGKIKIESKDDIKKRLRRSPDWGDALANTFWPVEDVDPRPVKRNNSWMDAFR